MFLVSKLRCFWLTNATENPTGMRLFLGGEVANILIETEQQLKMRRLLKSLNDPEEISRLEEEYRESFETEETDLTLGEIQTQAMDQSDLDAAGDLGVDDFKASDIASLRLLLGLQSEQKSREECKALMPFFARHVAVDGFPGETKDVERRGAGAVATFE